MFFESVAGCCPPGAAGGGGDAIGPRQAAGRRQNRTVANVYFELTREFDSDAPVASLASGQAVIYYRVAIMSRHDDADAER